MTMNFRSMTLLATLGSLALLAGAFIFQAFGFAPCELCLLQRWPHAAAILIGTLALLAGWRHLAWAGALAALTTAALGLYHTGVERGFWVGPTACSSSPVDGLSADELMNQILTAPLVRCNEVAWSLFGLSMASWNAVLSLALVLIWVMAARRD